MNDKKNYCTLKNKKLYTAAIPLLVYVYSILMICIMLLYIFISIFGNYTFHPSLKTQILDLVLWIIPIPLQLFCKRYIPNFLFLFYIFFLFISHFLGSIIGLYHKLFWYDLLVHGIFGYCACFIALYFFYKLTKITNTYSFFLFLFCIAFSALTAIIWEIIEYSVDLLFGESAQGTPLLSIDGEWIVPLNDTMEDICIHFIGILLFSIQYVLHKLTKKSFLMIEIQNLFMQ